jgi:transposase-like protein
MGRKPRVDRSPEEKWQIVQEGIKSGNVSETCRRHGIAPTLFYRWKDEAEQGAKAAEQTGSTTSRSLWRVGKNPRMDIGA